MLSRYTVTARTGRTLPFMSFKNISTDVSRYAAAKSYLVGLRDVTLFLPYPPTSLANQVRLTTYLTFSITTFLIDPCSYRHRSQFPAVILLVLREISRYVRESVGPLPVLTLSSHFRICCPAGCTMFRHIISQTERFKKAIEHKLRVLIFSTTFV